jgi:hypothetical protein
MVMIRSRWLVGIVLVLIAFSPLPPGLVGRIAVDTFRIETHGDVAVLAYETQEQQLCEYAGSYKLTADIATTIRCTQDGLTGERTGRPPAQYLAEVPDVFFVAGQPRTRRVFVRDAQGKVVGFVDRREGEDVRWRKS